MDLRELFQQILIQDLQNITEITSLFGGKICDPGGTLNTSEKRALFLIGFRNPEFQTGYFKNRDTPEEEFVSINLSGGEMDAFYLALGRSLSKRER